MDLCVFFGNFVLFSVDLAALFCGVSRIYDYYGPTQDFAAAA
jgi:hypothetical protein